MTDNFSRSSDNIPDFNWVMIVQKDKDQAMVHVQASVEIW